MTTIQYPEGGHADAPDHHYGEADTYDSRYDAHITLHLTPSVLIQTYVYNSTCNIISIFK
jgi:hypothetical protein